MEIMEGQTLTTVHPTHVGQGEEQAAEEDRWQMEEQVDRFQLVGHLNFIQEVVEPPIITETPPLEVQEVEALLTETQVALIQAEVEAAVKMVAAAWVDQE